MQKRWKILAGFALLTALVLVLWQSPFPDRKIELADGRVLRLRARTFGTQHLYVLGPPGASLLARVLPDAWSRRLGLQVYRHRTASPSLMVWVECRWRDGSPPPPDHAAILDSNGVPGSTVYRTFAGFPARYQSLYGWEFSVFPRRDRQLSVLLSDRLPTSDLKNLGSLVLGNPFRFKEASWTAGALPLTVTNTECELTLQKVMVEPLTGASLLGTDNTTVRLEARCLAERDATVQVQSLVIDDNTGNVLSVDRFSATQQVSPLEVRFSSPPWLWSKTVKLRVDYVLPQAGNAADQVRVSASWPPDETRTGAQAIPLSTGELYCSPLKHRESASGAFSWIPRWNSEMDLMLQKAPTNHVIAIASVQDDRRRSVPWRLDPPLANLPYRLKLMVLPGSQKVHLTVSVQVPRPVEFVFQPDATAFTPSLRQPLESSSTTKK